MASMIVLWVALCLLTLWVLFAAGRLRSLGPATFLLSLGVLPVAAVLVARLPVPRLEPLDWLALAVVATGLLTVWGGAVRWARQDPASPRVDASRMRWVPRPSHRATWVIAIGLSTVLTLAVFALDRPLVGLLPWLALLVAHRWAHQGEQGSVRVEARDLVLAGERVPIDAVTAIRREVQYLGPVRRARLVFEYEDRRKGWLVTGSPDEDVSAAVHLLQQQRELAAHHPIEREPARRPPEWLRDIHERGGRPVPLRPNREAT